MTSAVERSIKNVFEDPTERSFGEKILGLSSEFTLFNPLGSILVIPFSEIDQGALPSQWTVKFDRTHLVQSSGSANPVGHSSKLVL